MTPSDLTRLDAQLQRLHLHHIQSHYQAFATKAAEQQRSIERRIKNARFPSVSARDA